LGNRAAHLTNWSNAWHLTNCATFGKSRARLAKNIWPNAQRIWPNARAFDELRSHLVTVGRIDQMRCAFEQTRSVIGQMRACLAKRACDWPNARAIGLTLRNWSNSARLTNWSNALRDWPNAPYISFSFTV